MCHDFDMTGWTYNSEVIINSSVTAAAAEAERRVKALQYEKLEATMVATCMLGGLMRGFAVYYREKAK